MEQLQKIVPTYEDVVTVAETPRTDVDYRNGGKRYTTPKLRTAIGIAEDIVTQVYGQRVSRINSGAWDSNAKVLNQNIATGTVKRLLDEAVEKGDVIALPAAHLAPGDKPYGVSVRSTLYIGKGQLAERERRKGMEDRNRQRAKALEAARDRILIRHADEVVAEYEADCDRLGVTYDTERWEYID